MGLLKAIEQHMQIRRQVRELRPIQKTKAEYFVDDFLNFIGTPKEDRFYKVAPTEEQKELLLHLLRLRREKDWTVSERHSERIDALLLRCGQKSYEPKDYEGEFRIDWGILTEFPDFAGFAGFSAKNNSHIEPIYFKFFQYAPNSLDSFSEDWIGGGFYDNHERARIELPDGNIQQWFYMGKFPSRTGNYNYLTYAINAKEIKLATPKRPFTGIFRNP